MTPAPAPRRESGFTLVELTVVVLLLSIVAALVFGFLNGATETTTRTAANSQAESDSQLVLRTVVADLRSAYSIDTAYPPSSTCPTGGSFTASPYAGYKSCIRFTIVRPINSADTCNQVTVTYGINGGELRADREERTGTPSACASSMTSKTLLTGIVNDASHPFLSYYDRSGKDLLASPYVVPTNAATIKVTVMKTYRKVNRTTLTFSNVVALRNKR